MNFKWRSLLFLIGFLLFPILFSTEGGSKVWAQDTIVTENIPYWKKNAYTSYPVEHTAIDTHATQEFNKIKERYSSNDFNYLENQRNRLSLFEKLSRRINQFFNSLFPNWSRNTSTTIIYLLVLLGIIALLFVIYKIVFKGNKVWQKEQKEDLASEVLYLEKNLENIDIAQYIQKAIEAHNFELAIRYLYLENLQSLAKKGIIEWDYRKTNTDFLEEIKQEDLKQQFKNTTLLFNYIWFGKFEIDAEKFELYKQDFINFKNKINR